MTLHQEIAVEHREDATMRAAVLDGASGVRITSVPRPVPVLGEVLVKVIAAGVSPIDRGVPGAGGVPGHDFSGVVVSAPYEAFRLRPGDEVFGVSAAPRAAGSFAEYVAVPAQHVAPKPPLLSHAEAAAVPLAALTAWGAVVELGKAHEGQRILVHAGAGGVGHLAVQLAAYFGAHVVTTGSSRNLEWLRGLGAQEAIDYTATRFEQAVAPVDTVIDPIGDREERTGPRSLAVLRPGGLLVTLPAGSWPQLQADAARAGVRATGFEVVPDAATLAVIGRLLASGDLRIAVQEVLPLDRLAEAQALVAAGHVRGKVVLQIADY